jgi:hypothetical protein
MADPASTALLLIVTMACAVLALIIHVSRLNKRIQSTEKILQALEASTECVNVSTECLPASMMPDSEFDPIESLVVSDKF